MDKKEINFTVDPSSAGQRLDKAIAKIVTDLSRSRIDKLVENKKVTVNDSLKETKYKVISGDLIKIVIEEPKQLSLKAEKIPLNIVYEDDDLLVVDKVQGMVVHPSAGHPDHTLVNALLDHTPLSNINGEFRPGIVHRIDKDTSGLLMVAKNDFAHRFLSEDLKSHKTKRQYIALVHGIFSEKKGIIDAPIARDPKNRQKQAVVAGGRKAITHFQVLKKFDKYTLLSIYLETGRTHQIRVHMAYIGHPVAGDPLYGPKKTLPGNGQYLHAASLELIQPRSRKKLFFQAPLPDYFKNMILKLEKKKF